MSRKERETVMIDPQMKEDILSVLNVGEEETFPRFVRVSLSRELARRKGNNVGYNSSPIHAAVEAPPKVETPTSAKDDSRFGSLPPRQPRSQSALGVDDDLDAAIPPFLRRENREP